ncbi:unnamed protein product [Prorocentrum cordatum]|uniref:Sfi1 spindle body domain-containing protein n=1 Tax=Prorocentrum cordatum TaxID=2364126 RepID=A0ABN9TD50_9DINO|nr:unnamed protein product [Polarella glacialis]
MPQRSGPLAGCPCCRTPATTPSGSCSAPAPSSAGAGTGSCWRLAWCPGGSWPCTSGCGAATARSAGSRPPRCSSGATRARRGWTSRRMAQQLQRNHGRVLLQRCAAAWRHGRLQRRHAAELEQVRKAGVGRGVASSNIVAERLQRLRVVDAARRVLGAWARGAHRQRVRAQMDVGDRSAEVVARHFRAAQTAKVLRRIVHDWGRESLRERAQKASERSRLPEGIMERMADRIRAQHDAELTQWCLACWTAHSHREAMHRRHASELQELRAASALRGADRAERAAERFRAAEGALLAQCCLAAWARGANVERMHRQHAAALDRLRHGEQQLSVRAAAASVASRMAEDADLLLLGRLQAAWSKVARLERVGRKFQQEREGTADVVAERMRQSHLRELLAGCLAAWQREGQWAAQRARALGEREAAAERMAEKLRKGHIRELQLNTVAGWREEVQRAHRRAERDKHLAEREALVQRAHRRAERDKHLAEREALAEKFAEKIRDTHSRELQLNSVAGWREEVQRAHRRAERDKHLAEREALAEKFAEKIRDSHIRELQLNTVAGWREEVQRAHRRAERDKHLAEREAAAEKFAEKIRDTHSRELQLNSVAGWREEVQRAHRRAERDKHLAEREALAEKFAEKIRDTHSRELQLNSVAGWREEVQRAHRRAELDKHLAEREAAAQRMAQRLIIGHGQELLAATVAHWHKEAHRLKERSRELADKEDAAARMADQFEKNHCRHLLASCVGAWAGHASRERARARQAAELDQLRNAQRERGDATAERLADSWVRARLHELVRACLDSWTEGAQQLRARRGRAEQVAEQWRSESLGALQRACLAAWSAWCRDARLQQERGAQAAEVARLKAMQNSELEQLRHVQRERGDATAERMADQFKAAREVGLLQQCMARWAPLAKLQQKSKEAALRAAEEWSTEAARELLRCTLCAWSRDAHREAARARHAAEMESWRESERVRGDGTAELMAERLRAERLRGLLQACLGAWQDDRARERSRAQHAEHAALVQRVAGRLRATRERAAEAQCRARSRRALGACVGAWARRSSQQAARAQAGWARRRRPEGLCFHAWARLASRQAPPVARGSVATLGAVVDADQLVLAADALPEQDAQAEPLPPRELTVGEAEALVEEVVALRSAGAELRARREALEEENAGLRRHCAGALRHADALAERAAAALWRRSARHPGGRSFRGWAVQAARERRAAAAAPAEGPWVSVDGGPFVAVGPLPPGGGPAPAGAGGAFGGGGDSAGLALDSW